MQLTRLAGARGGLESCATSKGGPLVLASRGRDLVLLDGRLSVLASVREPHGGRRHSCAVSSAQILMVAYSDRVVALEVSGRVLLEKLHEPWPEWHVGAACASDKSRLLWFLDRSSTGQFALGVLNSANPSDAVERVLDISPDEGVALSLVGHPAAPVVAITCGFAGGEVPPEIRWARFDRRSRVIRLLASPTLGAVVEDTGVAIAVDHAGTNVLALTHDQVLRSYSLPTGMLIGSLRFSDYLASAGQDEVADGLRYHGCFVGSSVAVVSTETARKLVLSIDDMAIAGELEALRGSSWDVLSPEPSLLLTERDGAISLWRAESATPAQSSTPVDSGWWERAGEVGGLLD